MAEEGAGGSQAHGKQAVFDCAGADGRHHVVAASGGHGNSFRNAKELGGLPADSARTLARGSQGWKHAPHASIYEVTELAVPAPFPEVEQAGARGIAVFHAEFAGEQIVQVVVGQEDVAEF